MNEERIHSMDALRASSMFLLVPVHAAGLLAVNGHGGAWSTVVFWVVHVFRLPLFFAMSGFFLVLLLSRRGLSSTLKNRTVRIAGPLAIGLLTLVPLFIAASQATDVAFADGTPAGSPFLFKPSFLWFLWYLLIIDAAAICALLLAPRLVSRLGERMRRTLARPLLGIVLLAIPTTLALLPAANWTIQPPADTFVPEVPALLYYLLFFALGATFCAHRGLVEAARASAWRWSFCAIAAAIPAGFLYQAHNSAQLANQPLVHVAAMLTYAIATWTSVIALIGLADRYLTKPRPRLRYVADSSYWIYLSHLPALVLLVALFDTAALATSTQFALVTVGSLAFSMVTYALFVRYTAVGRLLNGRRERPQTRAERPARRTDTTLQRGIADRAVGTSAPRP